MEDKIYAAFAEIHTDGALYDSTLLFIQGESSRLNDGKKKNLLSRRVLGVAFMFFFAIGIFSRSFYFTTIAYLSFEINPSIELSLNRLDRVIGAYGFNGDGEEIISKTSLLGKTYSEAATLILASVDDGGYIEREGHIFVTVQSESPEKEQYLCKTLLEFIDGSVLSDIQKTEVEVFPITTEIREDSRNSNISPAKYLAILELMEVDEEAKVENYSHVSIPQIRLRTEQCHSARQESSDDNFETTPIQKGHGHGNHGHDHRKGR